MSLRWTGARIVEPPLTVGYPVPLWGDRRDWIAHHQSEGPGNVPMIIQQETLIWFEALVRYVPPMVCAVIRVRHVCVPVPLQL
jgi:hypothetical protein